MHLTSLLTLTLLKPLSLASLTPCPSPDARAGSWNGGGRELDPASLLWCSLTPHRSHSKVQGVYPWAELYLCHTEPGQSLVASLLLLIWARLTEACARWCQCLSLKERRAEVTRSDRWSDVGPGWGVCGPGSPGGLGWDLQ